MCIGLHMIDNKISKSEKFHFSDSLNLMQDEIESNLDQIKVSIENAINMEKLKFQFRRMENFRDLVDQLS